MRFLYPLLILNFALIALGGCTTVPAPEPRVVTRTVEVPVAVRCNPNVDPAPAIPATSEKLLAAPNLFARVQALLASVDILWADNKKLRAALKGCAGE